MAGIESKRVDTMRGFLGRGARPWTGGGKLALILFMSYLLHGCATPLNLRFPTLGGKQMWADERVDAGWRIQRHAWTGHHRLLDDGDVRRAWGRYEWCEKRLDRAIARGEAKRPSPSPRFA